MPRPKKNDFHVTPTPRRILVAKHVDGHAYVAGEAVGRARVGWRSYLAVP